MIGEYILYDLILKLLGLVLLHVADPEENVPCALRKNMYSAIGW